MAYARSVVHLSFDVHARDGTQQGESLQHHVCVDELLTEAFIARHTRFSNIGLFFSASGLTPQSFANPDEPSRCRWDAFVRAASAFPNLDAMLRRARGEWLFRRLGITVGT